MNLKRNNSSNRERGIALLMALFALMLLSAIAAGFMFLANTESSVNANYRASQQAYFAARAGLQEARARIMSPANGKPGGDLNATVLALTMPTAGAATGGIYITNPAAGDPAIQPWNPGGGGAVNPFFDDTLCKANFAGLGLNYGNQAVRCDPTVVGQFPAGQWVPNPTPSISPGTGTAAAMAFKWVRITLKGNASGSPLSGGVYPYQVDKSAGVSGLDPRQVCWTGTQQILSPAGWVNCFAPGATSSPYRPVYLLTSMAVTPTGSERTLSIEVADDPPFYNNSAVNSQDHVTLNGALTVDGYDSCSCDCSWADPTNKKDPTTYTCKNKGTRTCLKDKYGIYSNSSVDGVSGNQETVTAGTNPIIAEKQTDVTDIGKLIERYKTAPTTKNALQDPYNYTCNPSCGTHSGESFGQPPQFPPADPPLDVDASHPQSQQITYVPGSLTITGGSQGNGILVVDGDLDIHGGLQFYGLIIVRGIIKFSGGGADKTNIYGSVLAGQNSVDDTVLGGSAAISYNQCALESKSNPQPPRLISSREIEY